jgi:hypothetical protein
MMMKAPEASALGAAAVGTSSVLTAAVASACCAGPALAPVFVSVLGAGGLAAVAGLAPYSPLLLALSAGMLGFGFRQVYKTPACASQDEPVRISSGLRAARAVLSVAGVLWLASTAYALYGYLHQ